MSEEIQTPSEPTIGRLVTNVIRDIQDLFQKQVQLAKSEVKFSAKAVAWGVAAFGLAVLLLIMVVILGSITAAHLISLTGLKLAWSYLIVTGLYLLGAVLAVLFGIYKIRKFRLPKKTIESTKQIAETFKQARPS